MTDAVSLVAIATAIVAVFGRMLLGAAKAEPPPNRLTPRLFAAKSIWRAKR